MAYVLAIAFGITILSICLLKRMAYPLALVDRPDGRKCHQGEVPTVGGLAMFLSLLIMCAFWYRAPPGFLSCAFLLVLCGAYDDRFTLSARTRFIVQAVVAVAMSYWYGMVIGDLGKLLTGHTLALPPILAYPFTVFCVLGVINAVNMLDGVDGLAGGIVITALVWFSAIAFIAGLSAQAIFLLLLAVVTLGFLGFNMRYRWHQKATVFMGDAGSMLLGFALAWFAIDLTQHHAGLQLPAVSPIVAVWVVGLPILDTVVVMTKRIMAGHSPFTPGRDHLHHLLLQRKLSDAAVTWLMVAVSASLGLIGVIGWLLAVPDYVLSYGFVLLGGAYAVMHKRLAPFSSPLQHDVVRANHPSVQQDKAAYPVQDKAAYPVQDKHAYPDYLMGHTPGSRSRNLLRRREESRQAGKGG